MYVKVKDKTVLQYPYTIGHLKKENPNISFPSNISDEALAEFGVFKVATLPYPNQDYKKNVTEGLPVFIDNQWTVSWIITDATQEEIENKTEEMAIKVRNQRNALLTSTDWTQVLDAPVNQEAWAEYRQALRDLPQQDGFPWDVVFPDNP
jgi:hypothetical protein